MQQNSLHMQLVHMGEMHVGDMHASIHKGMVWMMMYMVYRGQTCGGWVILSEMYTNSIATRSVCVAPHIVGLHMCVCI